MNKRFCAFLIVFFCGLYVAKAQFNPDAFMIFKCDKVDRIAMHAATLRDSILIDTSQLSVKYRFTNRNIKFGESDAWCDIWMQIGKNTVKQTDLCLYYDNQMYSRQEAEGTLVLQRDSVANYPSNLFVEMFCDRSKKVLSVICGDFFTYDAMMIYAQSLPEINWRLLDELKKIGGYSCRKAVANYGGRTWNVWYTTEIPIPFGPWKLHGLPGLILAASDNGNFQFQCVSLDRDASPILRYVYGSTRDLKTLHTYLRHERNSYKHPYQVFANGRQATVVLAKSDGSMQYLDDDWQIPYNPIELE